jgi:hypothetical protein
MIWVRAAFVRCWRRSLPSAPNVSTRRPSAPRDDVSRDGHAVLAAGERRSGAEDVSVEDLHRTPFGAPISQALPRRMGQPSVTGGSCRVSFQFPVGLGTRADLALGWYGDSNHTTGCFRSRGAQPGEGRFLSDFFPAFLISLSMRSPHASRYDGLFSLAPPPWRRLLPVEFLSSFSD